MFFVDYCCSQDIKVCISPFPVGTYIYQDLKSTLTYPYLWNTLWLSCYKNLLSTTLLRWVPPRERHSQRQKGICQNFKPSFSIQHYLTAMKCNYAGNCWKKHSFSIKSQHQTIHFLDCNGQIFLEKPLLWLCSHWVFTVAWWINR